MRRKLLLLISVFTLATTLTISAQETEQFKPSGNMFGLLFADFNNTFSGGKNVPVFEVTRTYLGYNYAFSKKFSGRILFDATTQTIGGKTILSGYLRNAYIQFDDGKITLRGGLIGAEQISMADKFWGYRFITKPFIDYTGMTYSADLGILVKYKPADIITLDLSVTNGRGYKDIAPDTTLKLVTGFTLTPSKNLLFRGFYDMMGQGDSRQWTASLTGAYIGQTFTLGAEYLIQKNHHMEAGEDYSGMSIFTAFRFAEKFSLFARYDNLGSVTVPGDTEPWNLSKDGTNIIAGLDWSPAKGIRISPNFKGFMPNDEDSDFVGIIGLNVEAKF
jgi:hypothetical protein